MRRKPTYQELERKIESLASALESSRKAGRPGLDSSAKTHPNLGSLLHSINNNTQNVIYVKGLDGRFLLVNNNFCHIFNLHQDEVIGKTPLDIFPEDVAAQHLENDRRIVQARAPGNFYEQAELSDGRHEFISVKRLFR